MTKEKPKKRRFYHKCISCGYEWYGYKKLSKECPLCKRYQIKRPIKK